MSEQNKNTTAVESEHVNPSEPAKTPAVEQTPPSSFTDDDVEYHMSWRTGIAVFALALTFATTTFAITGPNFSIPYMVQTFPTEAHNANWIASAGLLCVVTIPNIVGTTSDRYGKRLYLLIGLLLCVIGSCVAGSAKNLKIIIAGQAITGMGGAIAIVSVPAGMEVVPAKYRPLVFGVMGSLQGVLGAVGGQFVFAACVQHNIGGANGWRFGFYIQAILFGSALVGILLCYRPPPTRLQNQQSTQELLKSIDFIGILLLTVGFAFIVVALIWGGEQYPWKNAHVIALLVVGPLIVVCFGLYEWKGRPDGILHHDFFQSRNFPILLALGAVDGMLLYGLSQFVPNEIRSLYAQKPIDVARITTFNSGFLCVGYFAIGVIVSKTKRFKVALIVTNLLTTVFLGLMARATTGNPNYVKGILASIGLLTAANTVIPVGGIALVVPSYLLATSNLILASVRVIGGLLGLTIFSVVYNSKATVKIPQAVIPILTQAGIPESNFPAIIGVLMQAPQALALNPRFPTQLLMPVWAATAQASAECYKYVWYCIMAAAAACFVAAFFLVDVPERMTNQVETVLETKSSSETDVEKVTH